MDVFQIQASLEELASRKKPASKEDMEKHLEKVAQMESLEPQILSGCWVDRDGIPLAVYFSWSKYQKGTKFRHTKVTHTNALTSC